MRAITCTRNHNDVDGLQKIEQLNELDELVIRHEKLSKGEIDLYDSSEPNKKLCEIINCSTEQNSTIVIFLSDTDDVGCCKAFDIYVSWKEKKIVFLLS